MTTFGKHWSFNFSCSPLSNFWGTPINLLRYLKINLNISSHCIIYVLPWFFWQELNSWKEICYKCNNYKKSYPFQKIKGELNWLLLYVKFSILLKLSLFSTNIYMWYAKRWYSKNNFKDFICTMHIQNIVLPMSSFFLLIHILPPMNCSYHNSYCKPMRI